MEYVVVALLAIGGVWAAVHGARLLVRAVRRADDPASSLRAVRGIRGLVIGAAAWALAAGGLSCWQRTHFMAGNATA